MAKAKINHHMTHTVTTEVKLTMSLEEAVAVLDVLRRIGGVKPDTRRKYTEAVLEALDKANVVATYEELGRPPEDLEGEMMFIGSDR